MTVSAISTTATSRPAAEKASHISMPIGPAPTITARRGLADFKKSRMARESSRLLSVKTPARSVPGMGGTKGEAPVDSRSLE